VDGSAEDQGEAIDPEVVECTERIAISYALATFLSQPYASAFWSEMRCMRELLATFRLRVREGARRLIPLSRAAAPVLRSDALLLISESNSDTNIA
jgi:hypothetical protein